MPEQSTAFSTAREQLTLAAILQKHIDAGTVAVKEIAYAAGVNENRAGRWRRGEYEPDMREFLRLVRNAPAVLKADLNLYFACVTRQSITIADVPDESELDYDRSGRVDTGDLLAVVAAAQGESQQAATSEAVKASADQLITPAEALALNQPLAATGTLANLARAIIAKIGLRAC